MTGNELKKRRSSLNLRQEDLARELDVVVSSVARWEQLKDEEISNSRMLELSLERIDSEKLKEYVESTSDEKLLKKIHFEFDSVVPHRGWLAVHLSNDFKHFETALNTEDLRKLEIDFSKENKELKKEALKQFKLILGLLPEKN